MLLGLDGLGCGRLRGENAGQQDKEGFHELILTHNRAMRSAVVVGAQGVIGRYVVEKLASLPDWVGSPSLSRPAVA